MDGVTSWMVLFAMAVCHKGLTDVMAGSNSQGSGSVQGQPSSSSSTSTTSSSTSTSTRSAITSAVDTTTSATTTSTQSSTPLTSVDSTASQATRAPFVIGKIFADIYRGSQPDCRTVSCSLSAFNVGLARSAIHCASLCSQDMSCLYYRIEDYVPTSRDIGYTSTSKLCYFFTIPPTITLGSFKFLGQL
ncbi:unnamed protein product [Lymnaea stagnalis]|uniref:Apple domain-containing protein n=1 Tax=Lymnaea stagnalis TaxID=6523 RepID=A0AAV2HP07_LYMST